MSHHRSGGQNAFDGLGRLDGLKISEPDLVLAALATISTSPRRRRVHEPFDCVK
jgi:hypothetical protein